MMYEVHCNKTLDQPRPFRFDDYKKAFDEAVRIAKLYGCEARVVSVVVTVHPAARAVRHGCLPDGQERETYHA